MQVINLQVHNAKQFVNFVNSAIQFTKENHMNDPKQQLLFTEWNHDDMDSDDYEEAYFNYLVDCLDKEEESDEF